jgi:hypothetical protein
LYYRNSYCRKQLSDAVAHCYSHTDQYTYTYAHIYSVSYRNSYGYSPATDTDTNPTNIRISFTYTHNNSSIGNNSCNNSDSRTHFNGRVADKNIQTMD